MGRIDELNRDEAKEVLDIEKAIPIRELPTVPQLFEVDCPRCKKRNRPTTEKSSAVQAIRQKTRRPAFFSPKRLTLRRKNIV